MGEWKDLIILLFGGGWALQIIRYISKKSEDEQSVKKNTKDICSLKEGQNLLRDKVTALEYSTAVKLAMIETQLGNLSLDIVDMKKDIKLILKANIYKGEE